MAETSDVFQLIRKKSSAMSKSQRKIANFLESHADTAPFLTVANIAKEVGVGEATVVRFANFLGFSGYTEMQQSLQAQIRKRLTTVERLNLVEDRYPEQQRLAYEILTDDMANIQQTIQTLDIDSFHEAVKRIHEAKSVTVVALRSSYALGYFFAFYLHLLLKNTQLVSDSDTMFEKLAPLDSGDLVVGISFSRYTSRTIQAMNYVRGRGVGTLAITDTHSSPLANVADQYLLAASGLPSFLDSFVAPLSIINALLTAVAGLNKKNISQHLSNMEELWEREGVYRSLSGK
ncbi:MurR/RpiR family transcriptional regulator [Paenactinomyces guangxiensis]|uniref:MurR/RpiR family transcriptional regulator n=1 Tax=Paenactinomyces guangxiensis TaxID=1490290 RepID=A0A7W1WSE1_9BACL|nr:MurR/RpiR family transcriptional regulator [Paenactinomyces guangxiensis]MBA4495157.1 MurR/RpiR family transcriptional regulator [Paenactinomyces guangxiensis]MBH8592159.1 MurR/RpiR family transcriptional regulator [Paenactinomyces guangxiensis]